MSCGDWVRVESVLPLRFGTEASFGTSLMRCTDTTPTQIHRALREGMARLRRAAVAVYDEITYMLGKYRIN